MRAYLFDIMNFPGGKSFFQSLAIQEINLITILNQLMDLHLMTTFFDDLVLMLRHRIFLDSITMIRHILPDKTQEVLNGGITAGKKLR